MYHLSVKPISRAVGRSSTAAIAYRAGVSIKDDRTGETHDYTRRKGVMHAELVLPVSAPDWAADRSALWNAAELIEKRKDARVAREYEVAIPKDLTLDQGIALVQDFARGLTERYGVVADFAVHQDDRRHWDGSEKGFDGYHAHVLTSTRKLQSQGFGEKAEPELSDTKRKQLGLGSGSAEVEHVREVWEATANKHLEQAGHAYRIDRRSLDDQGVDREPTQHLGASATFLERKGQTTLLGDINRQITLDSQQSVLQRDALVELNPQITDTQAQLDRAIRLQPRIARLTDKLEQGAAAFEQRFEAQQQREKDLALARQKEALQQRHQQQLERQLLSRRKSKG
jgi:ATP-dependent exoDNAse (exonuclease V) alpha subunit